MTGSLLILQVSIRVKAAFVDAFAEATLMNAQSSRQEPGILRFDVLQDRQDATRFVLFEVYKSSADQAAHRLTEHYLAWRETVEPMMAEPRVATTYVNLSPPDAGW